jgi:ABC-type iron transport system FetAB ATPase subunit
VGITLQAGRVAGTPALLVLDEVDAALDETNQQLIAALLKVVCSAVRATPACPSCKAVVLDTHFQLHTD